MVERSLKDLYTLYGIAIGLVVGITVSLVIGLAFPNAINAIATNAGLLEINLIVLAVFTTIVSALIGLKVGERIEFKQSCETLREEYENTLREEQNKHIANMNVKKELNRKFLLALKLPCVNEEGKVIQNVNLTDVERELVALICTFCLKDIREDVDHVFLSLTDRLEKKEISGELFDAIVLRLAEARQSLQANTKNEEVLARSIPFATMSDVDTESTLLPDSTSELGKIVEINQPAGDDVAYDSDEDDETTGSEKSYLGNERDSPSPVTTM